MPIYYKYDLQCYTRNVLSGNNDLTYGVGAKLNQLENCRTLKLLKCTLDCSIAVNKDLARPYRDTHTQCDMSHIILYIPKNVVVTT